MKKKKKSQNCLKRMLMSSTGTKSHKKTNKLMNNLTGKNLQMNPKRTLLSGPKKRIISNGKQKKSKMMNSSGRSQQMRQKKFKKITLNGKSQRKLRMLILIGTKVGYKMKK